MVEEIMSQITMNTVHPSEKSCAHNVDQATTCPYCGSQVN